MLFLNGAKHESGVSNNVTFDQRNTLYVLYRASDFLKLDVSIWNVIFQRKVVGEGFLILIK